MIKLKSEFHYSLYSFILHIIRLQILNLDEPRHCSTRGSIKPLHSVGLESYGIIHVDMFFACYRVISSRSTRRDRVSKINGPRVEEQSYRCDHDERRLVQKSFDFHHIRRNDVHVTRRRRQQVH